MCIPEKSLNKWRDGCSVPESMPVISALRSGVNEGDPQMRGKRLRGVMGAVIVQAVLMNV